MFRSRPVLLGVLLLTFTAAFADVKLPSLISDHMVLQRDIQVAMWGWADPGERVRVAFRGQEVSGQTDDDGRWQVVWETRRPRLYGNNILQWQEIPVRAL